VGYVNRATWWLASVISLTLEPSDRDAVLGDIAESGQSGPAALRDVLGLAARRRADLWREWATLAVGLVFPAAILLGLIARYTADGTAVYVWLYANNWDWALFQDQAFRDDLMRYGVSVQMSYLVLACWSWTGGLVIGMLSRRNFVVNGTLFAFALLSTGFAVAPHVTQLTISPRGFDSNEVVFEMKFYRVAFPILVAGAFALIPALHGIRHGFWVNTLRSWRPIKISLLILSAASLAAFILRIVIRLRFPNVYLRPSIWTAPQIQMLQVVAYWPVVYLAANACRRWHPWKEEINI
jgi:hypothetical protein